MSRGKHSDPPIGGGEGCLLAIGYLVGIAGIIALIVGMIK